jgi:hypothetical protein
MKFIAIIITLLCLTSCIELLDDITLNNDGSGTFKYSINLSSSKTKVNSILALDSIDGKKVPNKSEIEQKIIEFKKTLSTQPGISNVNISYNFDDFIFKLSCDFDNVKNLQLGIENTIKKLSISNISSETEWITFSSNKLERNIPNITSDMFKNSNWIDLDLLKSGTYTSISRFERTVESYSNTLTKVSKTKTSVMLQVKTDEMFVNPTILKNKIILKGE